MQVGNQFFCEGVLISGMSEPKDVAPRIDHKEAMMTQKTQNRLDRIDENFIKPQTPTHVTVRDDMRGALNLKKDRAQHRRYTSYYSDLQN
jgi:hypothetical protein